MARRPSLPTAALLVVLGVALLWVASGAFGTETDAVYQYTAYEVDYDDDHLVVTDAASGERLDDATHVNVDDRIVCLPAVTRQCAFERRAVAGDIRAEGVTSAYRYAYVDGTFYRINRNASSLGFTHERTPAADALAELAVDSDRLSDAARTAIADGRVLTARKLGYANRLVRHDGRYYAVLETAQKTYGEGGSFCANSGEDFCENADGYRSSRTTVPGLLGALGAVGVLVGGRTLLSRVRSTE